MKLLKLDFSIKKIVNQIFIAALVTGAAILFYACENDIEEIKAFSVTDDLPIAEAVDFETMLTDSGKISFTLKAPKLLRFKIEGREFTEFPEGMELRKFDEKGKIVSSIRSDYARQNVVEDSWEAKTNVVATNIQGDTLKTEHLIWERKNGSIHTDEFVTIISADRIMYGDGLTSDEQMQNWRILNLKGNIYITVDENQSNETDQQTLIDEPEKTKVESNSGELQLEK